jgi:hypothetical protein
MTQRYSQAANWREAQRAGEEFTLLPLGKVIASEWKAASIHAIIAAIRINAENAGRHGPWQASPFATSMKG